MSFGDKELEFCSYVEQIYLISGEVPGFEACQKALSLTRSDYMRLWNNSKVREYLEEQGIHIDSNPEVLLPIQIKVINALLDYNDVRPDHKKIKDLGVKPKQFQAWRQDPAFNNYLKKRVELIVGNHTDEVDRALFDAARSGDIQAIKLLYAYTGKYRETSNSAVDINFILVKIQEIVLRHVTDPVALQNIGRELELLTVNPVGAGQTIRGELG